MAAIIGLLDILLCDEYLSLEQVSMVSQIRHCSTALLRLLNNILDLSKVSDLCRRWQSRLEVSSVLPAHERPSSPVAFIRPSLLPLREVLILVSLGPVAVLAG